MREPLPDLAEVQAKTSRALIITDHGKPVLKVVPYAEDPEAWLKPLRHSVLNYKRPTEPVGEEDWDALQ